MAATLYTLTGPSLGDVAVASTNFTITPDDDATGIVVTPASTGRGFFTPATITFSGAGPETFTYTPYVATGSPHQISTTNDSGLINPAAVGYTVLTPPVTVAGRFPGYEQANQQRVYRESVSAALALQVDLTTPEIMFANGARGTVYVRTGNTMTSLTYYGAIEAGGTYLPLYSGSTQTVQTVAGGKAYDMPAECANCRFLKIVADVAETIDISIKG